MGLKKQWLKLLLFVVEGPFSHFVFLYRSSIATSFEEQVALRIMLSKSGKDGLGYKKILNSTTEIKHLRLAIYCASF